MKTARMLVILVLTLGLAAEVANADFTFGESTVEREPLRILFIGNSLTNQIRSTLNRLIQASPYSESTIEYVAPDWWTLQQHMNSENTMSKIRSSDWDFVVLQERSNWPTLPNRCGQFYDAVAKLSEAIKESGAQVVLYMIWGYRDGDPQNRQISPDYETMQQNLIEAYTEAARQVDAIIAPVGVAWQSVRRNKPDLGRQLYQSDGLHPSYKGAFLTACVFYATLFDADPTELAFNGGLSDEEAAYLRRKAKETVIPIVDFNGDGIVDSADMDIMVDHWHTDETLCDIGPMPWGDGIVDAQDMLVLTEYMTNEEVDVDADAIYKEMCDLYTLAVETGDLDLYVDVYTNDAVQIPPDAAVRIGSGQIRAAIEPALTSFNIVCPIYPQEARVIGNWAFGWCDWSLSLTPKEGGATTTFDGRSIDILKRQPDGSWKFYMSCWNYEGPPTVEE
jgi:ketosteroid isomerase-like protein